MLVCGAKAEFFHRHRVVLVEDRDDVAFAQETVEGVARVFIPGAAVEIVKKLGGNITGIMFLIELESLNGRSKFEGENVESLLTY